MTDQKISQLTSIDGANVDDANDLLPIVDTSETTTKRITRAELFTSVAAMDVTGDITVGGTVDGRDVSADGASLDALDSLVDIEAIARKVASGAVDSCNVDPWATSGDHLAWMLDGSKSWAKEARVTTTYLGVHNTTASAWAVSGAAAGDWYWDGTNRNIYILTGAAGATLSTLNRFGASPYFQRGFAIAYSDRVVMVDTDGVPWLVFETSSAPGADMATATTNVSSVCFVGSQLVIGTAQGGWGMSVVDFAADAGFMYFLGTKQKYNGDISQRNDGLGYSQVATVGLVNATVNAVAATVLPNAPADPVTGLPVPTIGVATDGGTSIRRDDGSVISGGEVNASWVVRWVGFGPDNVLWGNSGSLFGAPLQILSSPPYEAVVSIGTGVNGYQEIGQLSVFYGQNTAWPFALGASYDFMPLPDGRFASAASTGLTTIFDVASDRSKSMVSYQAPDYATPPMFGDIKTALLCERGTASLVGVNVYTSDFNAGVDGFVSNNSTISADADRLKIVDAGSNGVAYKAFSVTAGQQYVFRVRYEFPSSNVTNDYAIQVRADTFTGTILVQENSGFIEDSPTETVLYVTPTTGTVVLVLAPSSNTGDIAFYDNISVDLATPDRSVNGKGAVINGTLTRDADGWVSGFGASNFIEQPYNSDLDFGTGDFHFTVEAFVEGSGNQILFLRDSEVNGSAGYGIYLTGGQVAFQCGGSAILTDGVVYSDQVHHFTLVRSQGVATVFVDGLPIFSSSRPNALTNALATLRFGLDHNGLRPLIGASSSIRNVVIGAGAPSAAQIRIMANWKGDVIDGTIQDLSYVEETKGLWVLTSTYLYELGPDGAERSKQANDIGATTLTAFNGGRLVS